MKRLTKQQIFMLHSAIAEATGGSTGVLNDALLESALNAPFQSFGGEDAFPSIIQKGARLGFGLIKNHAFVDGNKRIGVHAMLVFLALNGVELQYTQEELIAVGMGVAASEMSFDDLLAWLTEHQI